MRVRLNKELRALGLFGAIAIGLTTGSRSAHAAIGVTNRSSSVSVSASAVGGFFGAPVFDSDQRSTPSTTDNFSSIVDALADSVGTRGESEARQNSEPTYVAGNLTRVQGSGSAFVNVLASGGGEARADALSDLFLQFTVPAGESYDFSFTGSLADDSGRTTAMVYLEDKTRGGDLLFRSGDAGAFATVGRLLPGEYELNARVTGLASELNAGSGNSSYSVDLVLTPTAVPEPATAALLTAVPAGLLARRRRARGA